MSIYHGLCDPLLPLTDLYHQGDGNLRRGSNQTMAGCGRTDDLYRACIHTYIHMIAGLWTIQQPHTLEFADKYYTIIIAGKFDICK